MIALPGAFRKIAESNVPTAQIRKPMDDKPKPAAGWIDLNYAVAGWRGFVLPTGVNFLSEPVQTGKVAQTVCNMLDR